MLDDILACLCEFYGEENLKYVRGSHKSFITVWYNDEKLLYLVRSGSGGWLCMYDKDPVFTKLEPFLITGDLTDFKMHLNRVNYLFMSQSPHKFISRGRVIRSSVS